MTQIQYSADGLFFVSRHSGIKCLHSNWRRPASATLLVHYRSVILRQHIARATVRSNHISSSLLNEWWSKYCAWIPVVQWSSYSTLLSLPWKKNNLLSRTSIIGFTLHKWERNSKNDFCLGIEEFLWCLWMDGWKGFGPWFSCKVMLLIVQQILAGEI